MSLTLPPASRVVGAGRFVWIVARWAVPAAAVVALALLSALPAQAAVRSARFWVTATGYQDIEWTENEHLTHGDCMGDTYVRGQGYETDRLTVPRRAAYVQLANGRLVIVLGSSNLFSTYPATGFVRVERKGGYTARDVPGPCAGGGKPMEVAPRYDCGRTSSTRAVSLGVDRSAPKRRGGSPVQRAVLMTGPHPFYKDYGHYNTCPLLKPRDLQAPGFTPIESDPLNVNALFNGRVKTIKIRANKRYQETLSKYASAEAIVKWEVTLTRDTSRK